MFNCYKDRTYCSNTTCINLSCSRHQSTFDERYSLKNNDQDLPLSLAPLSKTELCEGEMKNEQV